MSDVAFVIGRFQPYHVGHHALIHRAFQTADHVIVIIGDTGCRPDFRNPWTVEERKGWIESIWKQQCGINQQLTCVSVEDVPYDDLEWKANVKAAVCDVLQTLTLSDGVDSLTLVGHKKDASSFYLDLFPEWNFVEVDAQHCAGATFIREQFFNSNWERVEQMVDPVVWRGLSQMPVSRFNEIKNECYAIIAHDLEWNCKGAMQYGTQHVAVDALIECGEYVLMIERGGSVGCGALALPGGFVNAGERLVDAALRELKEETNVVLERSLFPPHGLGVMTAFDHPRRSMRGRIFTNVLHYKFPPDTLMPVPRAADDAKNAFWMLKTDIPKFKRQFFSDHWHIINHFVPLWWK